jgi:MFS family permease
LLAISVTSLLLATVWGGTTYPWASVHIIGLFATAVIGAGLFIWREHRAAEPILPLRLFKNSIFRTTTLLSLVVGIVMFGALIFLPQYQQIVRGDSATKSGLMLLPLIGGLMIASVTSGRIISKIGRYRIFPIIGTTLISFAFWLFSHITATTPRWELGIWMAVLGLGIGQVMPVLTLAVQNAVDRADLGTGTSSVVFFRTIGSALGAAMFGAILSNRLVVHITKTIPGPAGLQAAHGLKSSAQTVHTLSPALQHTVLNAFAASFHDVFLVGIPFAIIALIVALQLKEAPLRTSNQPASEPAL